MAGKIKDEPFRPTTNKVNAATEPMWPASDAQIKYVLGLQAERELPANHAVKEEGSLRLMERDQVSAEINLLKSYPWKGRDGSEVGPTFSMPEGRYALLIEQDGEATWRFYQVTRSDKPRWKGYTFITRLIGSVGDYAKVPMPPNERQAILSAIEGDPVTAAANYGKQTHHCGRCHSPLTHKRSRAAGYGEKCAGAVGWPW
jgi:hypothetical protein